ncbi:MAG: hypothetical protein OXH68_20650 [Gammaproteobacteria bacterium]|nr:hypothetical protein [Gammaproteobacteria bacterium]
MSEHASGDFGAGLGVRPNWAAEVGKPQSKGIRVNVGVRLSGCPRDGLDYQIRGVVDVPSPPYGDDENTHLAKVLARNVEILCGKAYEYAVLDWRETDGGDGVRVHSWRDVRASAVTDDDIIAPIEVFTPPEFEDAAESIAPEDRAEWGREYAANRYCRHETRTELNQRYQDLLVNLQVLTLSGKLGQTADPSWHRLLHHVLAEMDMRAQPPTPWNLDPTVREARPFFDGELCRTAANVVAARGTAHHAIVKYGRREHMERLIRGEVYLNSATNYNASVHNQAVRDDEHAIDFKGGYLRALHPTQYYNRDSVPPASVVERGSGFRPVFDAPGLAPDEYATTTVRMATDYWMFCASDLLDPRLFADFEADCCVVLMRRPFVERLAKVLPPQLRDVKMSIGRVHYVDPLGAMSPGMAVRPSMPVHMTKVFRYAYQREVRFVALPNSHQERLEPRPVQIGSLLDIAELVPLPESS